MVNFEEGGIMKRIAAPMEGGMISATKLTL